MYVCIVCGIVGKAKFLFGDVGQVDHNELPSSSSIACLQVIMNIDIHVTLPSFLPSQGTNVKLVVNMIMGTMMGM